MDNYYDVLAIEPSATADEIKQAFRKLASLHHPDKGGDTAKFQSIQAAYAVLGDVQQREQYDRSRSNPFVSHANFGADQSANRSYPPGMEDLLKGFNFGTGGGNPFEQFRPAGGRKNSNISVQLTLTLEETLLDQRRTVRVNKRNGQPPVELEIQIPRGSLSGTVIKYTGQGDHMFENLAAGDLMAMITIRDHTQFQVQGLNLIQAIDLCALDAIIGCTLEFSSLEGKAFELTVPAGTQPGQKFKVSGQGLYQVNTKTSSRGDMLIIANIQIPTNLSQEQLDTIKQLIKAE
jgi:DnaJ-class molecular chaperone